jgi:pimeloyl-ACP methyl ester carboxylesterase
MIPGVMDLMKFLAIIVLLYFVIGLILYLSQRNFIFYRTPKIEDIESVYYKSCGETIEVHVVNPGLEKAVIYFGGNAETVGYNIDPMKDLIPAQTIYLVNYRGYSGSTGTPSEKALFEDALTIYDRIKEDHKSISVIGRSLGSGVATYLAVERDLEKVVLVTPFDSIKNVAQRSFPIYPMGILLKDKFESVKIAKEIKGPTLILIAGRDQVIPNARSIALAAVFTKEILTIETIHEADHNDISTYTRYSDLIKCFLEK